MSERVSGDSLGGVLQFEMLLYTLEYILSKIILADRKNFSVQMINFSQPAQRQFMRQFYLSHYISDISSLRF